jgi:RNA polymerase sigma factor (sigma-70 family)
VTLKPRTDFGPCLRRAALLHEGAGLTDGQLLEQYLQTREEVAFEALVRRHGPMVLGVCRRVTGNEADAEDAFQATFLLLVRKAATVLPRARVGNWLYGVAYVTARRARAAAAKRRAKERKAAEQNGRATEETIWSQLAPVLDQELHRLPEMQRLPIVLCDLEGKTRKEAARQLGVAEGTVARRLARGRALLAKRLARHGVAPSATSLAALLAENTGSACVPATLLASTARTAAMVTAGQMFGPGTVSATVNGLAQGVAKAMLLTKLKMVPAAVALILLGTVVVAYGVQACGQPHHESASVEPPAAKADDKPKEAPRPEPLDPKLVTQLAEQLRSKDHQERSDALTALAKLLTVEKGAATDCGPLIEPLADLAGWGGIAEKDARVAEELLVRIGKQAAPALRERLKSQEDHDRRSAVEVLIRIGPADASLVPLLRPLLRDKVRFVRRAAIQALDTLGPLAKDVVGDLEDAAAKDAIIPNRVTARVALIHVAGASDERVRALGAFLELQDSQAATPAYEGAAAYAASELVRLGPKAKAAAPQLFAALKHSDAGVRIDAATALAAVGAHSKEAVAVVIELLKDHARTGVGRSAAAALGEFGPAAKPAIPALCEALNGEGGGWWVAADALGRIGGEEVVPILADALTSTDADIRLVAMQRLGDLGPLAKPAVEALQNANLNDPRPTNRKAAAEALQKIKGGPMKP